MKPPSLAFAATLAARNFDVALDVAAGETVALLGPNGAGKSTLLEILAGLVRPDTAAIALHAEPSRVLAALGGSGRETWVAPYERRVGLLAQDPGLFPHLSVRANVEFGPRSRRTTRAQARTLATDWLDRVQLADLAERRPHELSGGQAQRVAIARAMAADPDVVVLDEPFAALDVEVAALLRTALRDILAERTTLMATHDVLDPIVLADRVVVLDHGSVVEDGPAGEVLRQPRSPFAASLAGFNLISGRWDGRVLVSEQGHPVWGRPSQDCAPGAAVVAVFRPSAVAVYAESIAGALGSPRNRMPVLVEALEPLGAVVRVRGAGLIADLTPDSVAQLGLAPGVRAHFVVKAAEVDIYPR